MAPTRRTAQGVNALSIEITQESQTKAYPFIVSTLRGDEKDTLCFRALCTALAFFDGTRSWAYKPTEHRMKFVRTKCSELPMQLIEFLTTPKPLSELTEFAEKLAPCKCRIRDPFVRMFHRTDALPTMRVFGSENPTSDLTYLITSITSILSGVVASLDSDRFNKSFAKGKSSSTWPRRPEDLTPSGVPETMEALAQWITLTHSTFILRLLAVLLPFSRPLAALALTSDELLNESASAIARVAKAAENGSRKSAFARFPEPDVSHLSGLPLELTTRLDPFFRTLLDVGSVQDTFMNPLSPNFMQNRSEVHLHPAFLVIYESYCRLQYVYRPSVMAGKFPKDKEQLHVEAKMATHFYNLTPRDLRPSYDQTACSFPQVELNHYDILYHKISEAKASITCSYLPCKRSTLIGSPSEAMGAAESKAAVLKPHKFLLCSGCSLAWYCSSECQRMDWSCQTWPHKDFCKHHLVRAFSSVYTRAVKEEKEASSAYMPIKMNGVMSMTPGRFSYLAKKEGLTQEQAMECGIMILKFMIGRRHMPAGFVSAMREDGFASDMLRKMLSDMDLSLDIVVN